MDIKALAKEAEAYIIERRRWYHAHPELTWEEVNTRAQIHADLEALGVTEIRDMESCYGLVATIRGGKPGKTVALRADIDALPVHEESGASFCSTVDGKMHACGHDCHIAMLLGAVKILMAVKDELCGDVRIIAQPAEEVCGGAKKMIEEGCLEGVDAVYGAHIWGNFDAPYIDITAGPRMAYAGIFEIDIEGVAAHGSAPHLGIDAITAAAAVIQNVQQYVSRMNDPLNPLACTIGTIEGGSRFNVIPNHVHMTGTLRAYTGERHKEVLTRIIENTCSALGCKGILKYDDIVGALINSSEELNAIARNAVTKLYGAESLGYLEKMLGSEDFAYYGEHVPSVFAFIGSRNPDKGLIYTNHHEKYMPDEDTLQRGSAVMAQFAVDFLNR